MRTITFTLDKASIAKAIKEVEQFKEDLRGKIQLLVERLMMDGAEIAKLEVLRLGAFDTGYLADSIQPGVYDAQRGVGIIRAGAYYAIYVEYGTGIKGSAEPHPLSDGRYRQTGWYYYNEREGKVMWTTGQPSSPFMYNTYVALQRKVNSLASEILGNV